ncbi:hypothetical protein [Roseibacillus persicicus]
MMEGFWNRVFPRNYSTKLTVAGKELRWKGDKMSAATLREIQEVLASSACEKGSIVIKKDGSVSFSQAIPKGDHQRIRNLIRLRS